jgi:hypothetical protein
MLVTYFNTCKSNEKCIFIYFCSCNVNCVLHKYFIYYNFSGDLVSSIRELKCGLGQIPDILYLDLLIFLIRNKDLYRLR